MPGQAKPQTSIPILGELQIAITDSKTALRQLKQEAQATKREITAAARSGQTVSQATVKRLADTEKRIEEIRRYQGQASSIKGMAKAGKALAKAEFVRELLHGNFDFIALEMMTKNKTIMRGMQKTASAIFGKGSAAVKGVSSFLGVAGGPIGMAVYLGTQHVVRAYEDAQKESHALKQLGEGYGTTTGRAEFEQTIMRSGHILTDVLDKDISWGQTWRNLWAGDPEGRLKMQRSAADILAQEQLSPRAQADVEEKIKKEAKETKNWKAWLDPSMVGQMQTVIARRLASEGELRGGQLRPEERAYFAREAIAEMIKTLEQGQEGGTVIAGFERVFQMLVDRQNEQDNARVRVSAAIEYRLQEDKRQELIAFQHYRYKHAAGAVIGD